MLQSALDRRKHPLGDCVHRCAISFSLFDLWDLGRHTGQEKVHRKAVYACHLFVGLVVVVVGSWMPQCWLVIKFATGSVRIA